MEIFWELLQVAAMVVSLWATLKNHRHVRGCVAAIENTWAKASSLEMTLKDWRHTHSRNAGQLTEHHRTLGDHEAAIRDHKNVIELLLARARRDDPQMTDPTAPELPEPQVYTQGGISLHRPQGAAFLKQDNDF